MTSMSPACQKTTNQVLRRINLSLSPDKHFSQRINLLPKLEKFKKRRRIAKSYKSPKMIELSQKVSPKNEETLDQFCNFSKCLDFSPSVFKQTVESKRNYFRPKPLTPASLRMYNFAEYKHRLTRLL